MYLFLETHDLLYKKNTFVQVWKFEDFFSTGFEIKFIYARKWSTSFLKS